MDRLEYAAAAAAGMIAILALFPAPARCHSAPAAPTRPASLSDAGHISPVIPFGYGINIHEFQFSPAEYKLYHDAGFGLIRFDFQWPVVERTPGIYDFSKYDRQLAQLDTLGVRPVWGFEYTNANYDNNQPPHTAAGVQAYANFAGAAAAHFRGRGVIWEIWNEPNESVFWLTGPNADQYAVLVKATVKAIRAADPDGTILVGAISQFNLPYITEFLKDDPLDGATALSIHPYREGQPESVISDYETLRNLIAKYTPAGRKPTPIVCSEWGYSTATGENTEAEQARYITRVYLTNLLCGVNLTINYDWTDDGPNPADDESRYGIVRQDLTPKPAYTAISELLNKLRGYAFRHRLYAKSSSDYRLLFNGPNGLAVVSWTSDDTASAEAQTPKITMIGKHSPSYSALLRLARAQTSPYDRPYPDVLPKVPGIVTVITSASPPLSHETNSGVPPTGDQRLVNSGFEDGTIGWFPSGVVPGVRLGITDAVSRSGSHSAFMSIDPGNQATWVNWGQTVSPVAPGDQYSFTGYVKKEDVHGIAGWYVQVYSADGRMLYNATLTSQSGYSHWDKLTTSFTVPAGGAAITVGTNVYGTGVAYFDDASLVRTGHAN